MRLWSIHPKYLDSKGLIALWRESLLAQAVLAGKTKGYKNHPQLNRFKAADNPLLVLSAYLHPIADEALRRNYKFDTSKILYKVSDFNNKLPVTLGQIIFEWHHLMRKLAQRDIKHCLSLDMKKRFETHSIFYITDNLKIEPWEKI